MCLGYTRHQAPTWQEKKKTKNTQHSPTSNQTGGNNVSLKELPLSNYGKKSTNNVFNSGAFTLCFFLFNLEYLTFRSTGGHNSSIPSQWVLKTNKQKKNQLSYTHRNCSKTSLGVYLSFYDVHKSGH